MFLSDFKNAGTFNLNLYVIAQYLGLYEKNKELTEILEYDKAMDFNNTEKELSHILIANDISEIEVLETCESRLVSGGKIVIYQRSLSALEKVAEWLFERKNYQNVNVIDSFLRKIQVLPKRTHPEMAGETFGGYILTAYKVDNDF